jgi:hypothetical protein
MSSSALRADVLLTRFGFKPILAAGVLFVAVGRAWPAA